MGGFQLSTIVKTLLHSCVAMARDICTHFCCKHQFKPRDEPSVSDFHDDEPYAKVEGPMEGTRINLEVRGSVGLLGRQSLNV